MAAMAAMTSVQQYERAERELTCEEPRLGFRIHAIACAAVTSLVIAINLPLITQTSEDVVWFAVPLFGWGIGLAMHYSIGV